MRIALFNHDDVVTSGIASILDRDASDIEFVRLRSRDVNPVDVVLVDPANSG